MIVLRLRTSRSRLELPPREDEVYWDYGDDAFPRIQARARLAGKCFFTYHSGDGAWLRWTHNGQFTGYCWSRASRQFIRRGDLDDND